MNLVIMSGRLTRDPEVRTSESGKAYARYSIAVDRMGKDSGTDFFNCISFGGQAEFVQNYLKKGTKIIIQGSIQQSQYTDKDNQKRTTTTILVDRIEFAESRRSQGQQPQQEGQQSQPQVQEEPQQIQEPEPQINGFNGFMNIPDGIEEELPFC